MKIIFDTDLLSDNITTITADSEDASFPIANVQNDYSTDFWKAASGVHTASISILASKGSAVLVYNTNAYAATIIIGSGETYADYTGYSQEAGFSYKSDGISVTGSYNLPGVGGRLWADFAEFTTPFWVTVVLTATATIHAGIVRCGYVQDFNDPGYGMSEASNDYSVELELNNGAEYFRKRNVVRTFSGLEILETRANAWLLKHDIFDAVGPKPLAIRLISNANVTDDEFVLFAKRVSPPEIEHVSSTHSRISLELKEVI
jgi:hypothetical protein